MSWWGERRKYEDEYTLASRIGHIVGRKMIKDNTRIIKFNVRPDNELANWFSSELLYYSTYYGGWSHHACRKCFRSELFSGWIREQLTVANRAGKEELYSERPSNTLLVVRSKYTILFLNVLGIPVDARFTIRELAHKLVALEHHDTEVTWEETHNTQWRRQI